MQEFFSFLLIIISLAGLVVAFVTLVKPIPHWGRGKSFLITLGASLALFVVGVMFFPTDTSPGKTSEGAASTVDVPSVIEHTFIASMKLSDPDAILADPNADIKSKTRAEYVENFQNFVSFYAGGDVLVKDDNGTLLFYARSLDTPYQRYELLHALIKGPLNHQTRLVLCDLGFQQIEVMSSAILQDGVFYPVECRKQTGFDIKDHQTAERTNFIKSLDRSFLDSNLSRVSLSAKENRKELLLTSSELAVQAVKIDRALWGLNQNSEDSGEQNLCQMGFIGLRIKSDPSMQGSFVRFKCKVKH